MIQKDIIVVKNLDFFFLLDIKSHTKNLLALHCTDRVDPNFNSICDQSKK